MGLIYSKPNNEIENDNDTNKPLLKQGNSHSNVSIPDYTLLESDKIRSDNENEIVVPTDQEENEPLFVEFQLLVSDVDLRLFRKRNNIKINQKSISNKDEAIKELVDERASSDYVILIDDVNKPKQQPSPISSKSSIEILQQSVDESTLAEEIESRRKSILVAKHLAFEEQERRVKEESDNSKIEFEQKINSINIANKLVQDDILVGNSNEMCNDTRDLDLSINLEEEERSRRILERDITHNSTINVNKMIEDERQQKVSENNILTTSVITSDVISLTENERKRRILVSESNSFVNDSKDLVIQLAEEERIRRVKEMEFNVSLRKTTQNSTGKESLPEESTPEEIVDEYASLIEIQRNLLKSAFDKLIILNNNSKTLSENDYFQPITETYFDLVPMPLSELPEEFHNECLTSDLFAARLRLRMLVNNIEVRLQCDDEIDSFEENLFFQRLLINDKVNRIIAEQYEYEPVKNKPLEMWTTVMIEFAFNKVNDANFLSLDLKENESETIYRHNNEVFVGSIIGVYDPVIDDYVFQDFDNATEFLRLYDEALEKKITYKNGIVAAKKNSAVAHLASKFASRRLTSIKAELDAAIKVYNDFSVNNSNQIELLNARAKSVHRNHGFGLMVSELDLTNSYYLSFRELNCWQLDNKLFEQKDFDIKSAIDNTPNNFELVKVENDNDLLTLHINVNGLLEIKHFKATIENIHLLHSYLKDYLRSSEELQIIRDSLSKVENESKKISVLKAELSILEEEFKSAEENANLKKEQFKEAELKIRDLELIYKTQISEQKFLNDKRRKLQLARTNIYALIAKGEHKKKREY